MFIFEHTKNKPIIMNKKSATCKKCFTEDFKEYMTDGLCDHCYEERQEEAQREYDADNQRDSMRDELEEYNPNEND